MKLNRNNISKCILLLMFLLAINFTLISQTDWTKKRWETIHEGTWEFLYDARQGHYYGVENMYQEGQYIIIPAIVNEGKSPLIINGKPQYSPLLIWDTEKDSFPPMTDGWVENAMKIEKVFKYDSTTCYVTDGIRMYKVEIDYKARKRTYTKVFQGSDNNSSDKKVVSGFHKGKNYNYAYGHHYIHLFNIDGSFIKSYRNYEDGESTILSTTSVVEYDDTVYFGYTFAGGLGDGSGMATLDLTTGKITKQYSNKWSAFHYEPVLRLLNGHFYLHCDAVIPNFGRERTLFEYKNGDWTALISKCSPPELINKQIIISLEPRAFYVGGDTINKRGQAGCDYLLENNIAVKRLDPDPRLLIEFDEDYKTEYYQRHNNMPGVVFIFEINNEVYGIANHVIAKLVNKPTSVLEVSKTNVLKTYPNPAKDVLHISDLPTEVAYTVTDMTGKIILTGNTMESIDISSLTPGMYVLCLMENEISLFSKFTKE